jgi:hypothetical protein
MAQAVGNSMNASAQGLAAMYSPLSQVILGHNSVYNPSGSQALTPTARDDTTYIAPANGVQTPVWAAGNQIIYSLPKTATLIGKMWHEISLSAGQTTPNPYTPPVPADPVSGTPFAPATNVPLAEYIKNIGDLICSYVILRYGSTPLQQYTTDMVVAQRFLDKNNINIQDVNVEVLGNLNPGGNSEQTLIDAFYRGVTLRQPLDEIWFTKSQDRHWMPESLALEGTLNFTLRDPQFCIITQTGTAATISTMPTITNCVLRYQQITLSAAEKMNRLALYKSPEGNVNLFEDCEDQLGWQISVPTTTTATPPALVTLNVPLSNFRMDSKQIIFYVRVAANNATYASPFGSYGSSISGWKGSRMESDRRTGAIVSLGGGGAIGTLLPIFQYKLVSTGKDLFNYAPDLWNRTHMRKQYHADSEVTNFIYSHSFAIYPEDDKNATGHISTSTLGNLTLVIQLFVPNTPTPGTMVLQVDAHSKAYNLMQSRAGSMAKAQN